MKELKEFMRKQPVWHWATAVALGFAFYQMVQQLVFHVLDPLVASLFGRTNFSQEVATMGEGAQAVQIAWGSVTVLLVNIFVLLGVVYLVLWFKAMMKNRKK